MTDETYNGWTNWDTWHIPLTIENTEASYKWKEAWKKNLLKKKLKGKFDEQKAMKVVDKYIIPTARGKGQWAKHFARMERMETFGNPEINPKNVNRKEILKWLMSE